jgi:hypothetical protein
MTIKELMERLGETLKSINGLLEELEELLEGIVSEER